MNFGTWTPWGLSGTQAKPDEDDNPESAWRKLAEIWASAAGRNRSCRDDMMYFDIGLYSIV